LLEGISFAEKIKPNYLSVFVDGIHTIICAFTCITYLLVG